MPELMAKVKTCQTCTQFIPSAESPGEGFCMIACSETLQSQWTNATGGCKDHRVPSWLEEED
mgnify:CR=1 FL=1